MRAPVAMSGTMEIFWLPGGIRLTGPGAASSQPPQRATGRTGTWLPSLTSMPVGSAFSQGLPGRQGPQLAGFSYLTGPPSGCFAPTPSRLSPQAGSSARSSPAHAAPDPGASMTACAQDVTLGLPALEGQALALGLLQGQTFGSVTAAMSHMGDLSKQQGFALKRKSEKLNITCRGAKTQALGSVPRFRAPSK